MVDFVKKYAGQEPVDFAAKYSSRGQHRPTQVQVPPGFEPIDRVSPFGFLQSALGSETAGPLVGLGETIGLVTPGTAEILRQEHEKNRINFFAEKDSAGRFAFAASAEALAMIVPLAPGGFLGRLIGGKVAARGAGPVLKALTKGGVAGASEGAVVGIGGTTGLEGTERLKAGLQLTAAGAGLGAAGAGSALLRRTSRASDVMPIDKYMAEPGARGDALEDTRSIFQKLADGMLDDKGPILRLGKKVGGPEGARLERLVHRMRISRKAAANPVFRAPRAWNGEEFVRTHHEALADILKDLPKGGRQNLSRYLLARREIELATRKRAGDRLKLSEQAEADAHETVNALISEYGLDGAGRINVMDEAASRYQEWSKRAILVPLHQAGIISDNSLARILGKNEHHAIYARLREHLFRPSGESGKPLKFIGKGLSKTDLVRDPIEEAAFMSMRVSELVDRQLVRQQLVGMAERHPDLFPDIEQVLPETRTVDIKLTPAERKRLGVPPEAEDRFFEVFRLLDARPEEGAFVVYRDGGREVWGAPAPVLRALDGTNPLEAKLALRAGEGFVRVLNEIVKAPTKTLRAGALTTLGFVQRNPLRDNFSAFVNSRHGFIPFWDPAKTLIDEIFTYGRTGQHSKLWNEFVDSGTMGSTLVGLDRLTGPAQLRAVRRLGTRGKVKHFINETLGNPLYPLQALRDLSESLTRASEFKLEQTGGRLRVGGLPVPFTRGAARDVFNPGSRRLQGGKPSVLRGSADAAEVSLDFSRAGTVGKLWNAYEPFINAELQDFSKFFRKIREEPLGATVRAVTGITLPALAVWARWRKDPEYQKAPEWEKKMFLHVSKRPDGGWHMIPRPLGMLNVMYGLAPEAAARFLEEKDPEAADRFAEALVDETPIGLIYDPLVNRSLRRPISSISPAIADPLLENYFNYDQYFEREVVPRRLQKEFPERQFTSATPRLAVGLGKALGVSPMKVQNLIEGYFGGVGSDLLRSAGILMAGERAVPLDPRVGLRGTPFIGSAIRATQSPGGARGLTNQFARDIFELRDESQKAKNAWDAMVEKQVSEAEMLRFLAEHPEALLANEVAASAQMLAQQGVLRRETLEEESLPEEERMHLAMQMDEAIDVLSVEAMKAYTRGLLEIRVQMLDQLRGR